MTRYDSQIILLWMSAFTAGMVAGATLLLILQAVR